MSQKSNFKNYYDILGISYDASTFDIQNAYQKLATQWHPDRHTKDRTLAQRKFHDISEAYDILSDRNKRSHYNEMLQTQFSLQDANKTFEQFFGEHDIIDEEQQKFFNTHYPEKAKNYYRILGVSKNATLEEIKNAYRKLALKYHPKNNAGNQQAHRKFVDVNEAYNALSNELKRQTYDQVLFNQIQPLRAHNIFQDFLGNRWLDFPQQEQIFKPIVDRSWRKRLDKMMDIQDDFGEKTNNGQSYKSSTVYSNRNGVQTKKTISNKKKVQNGKVVEETTQEYLLPTGKKEVVKTIKDGSNVTTKKYILNKSQELPKELTQ